MFNASTPIANPRVFLDVGSQGYSNWLQKWVDILIMIARYSGDFNTIALLHRTTAFETANQNNEPTEAELNDGEVSALGNLSSMSGGSRRNDFYDYHDSEPAGTDYVEGDVSGYAYQKPAIDAGKPQLGQIQVQHVVPQQPSVPMNPYLAINHGIEDFKHQNTEGRRTIHKGIYLCIRSPPSLLDLLMNIFYLTFPLYSFSHS